MKTSRIATAAAVLAQSHQVQAGPIHAVTRGFGVAAELAGLLQTFLGLAMNFFPEGETLWYGQWFVYKEQANSDQGLQDA
jgi:hypothetical protein